MDTDLITRPFVTVILAAGKGKRMLNPDFPKVMYRVNGKSMIDHVVELSQQLRSKSVIVVVGFKREVVMEHLRQDFGASLEFAVQAEQLGTGHAVFQTEDLLKNFEGDVLLLYGDTPLLTFDTMTNFMHQHWQTGAALTVLTAKVDDPTGYGRIIRLPDGSVDRIVEDRDATPEQRSIDEINSGIYMFRKKELFDALHFVRNDNAQHEYYVTDVLGYLAHHGKKVSAVLAKHFDEIRGVNTNAQLEEAERASRDNSEVFRR